MKGLKKVLIYFIAPVAAIVVGFNFGKIPGLVLLLAYIGYIFYKMLPSVYTFIGGVKYARSGIKEAAEWYGKAYKTGRAKPQVGNTYGYLMLKDGRLEESEKVFSEILKSKLSEDEKMLLKSNMALVHWKKGNLDGAIEMLEEIQSKFKNTNIYGSLGYLLVLKGDFDRALKFNLEAYEYNNSNGVILDNLGETYYHLGEFGKSEEIFKSLMEKNPSFPEAYYHYSLLLLKKGEKEKAFETVKKALDYKITFLSGVTKAEIEEKIREIEEMTGS